MRLVIVWRAGWLLSRLQPFEGEESAEGDGADGGVGDGAEASAVGAAAGLSPTANQPSGSWVRARLR